MTTLTDRYVAEVARRLPERSRDDISREIRATLADMIDSHDPVPAEDAERSAIVELGDPALLARQYADQPQYLIGPEVYPAFIRAMVWLLPIAAAISIIANVLGYAATDDDPKIGEMIGTGIGNVVMALLVTGAIITIIAALLERVLPDQDRAQLLRSMPYVEWDVDDLWRDPPTRRVSRGESIAALVVMVLMVVLPFLPASFFYVPDVPDGEGLLNPDLWSGWIPAYLVLVALLVAVEIGKLVTGALTLALLWASIAADLLVGVFLTVLLLTQDVLNPALPVATSLDDVPIIPIVLVAIWIAIIGDQIDTIRKYRLAASQS